MHSFQLRSIAVADSAWKYSHSQLISSHWKDNSTICIRSRKINVVQRTNNIGIFALHSAVCNVQCSAMCNAMQSTMQCNVQCNTVQILYCSVLRTGQLSEKSWSKMVSIRDQGKFNIHAYLILETSYGLM